MITTAEQESTMTIPRSTRPPFDPELGAILASLPAEIQDLASIGPKDIPAFRAANAARRPDPAALVRGGAVAVTERLIPGPPGAPELPVLILRPTRGPGPWPAVYHVHGGGMISGDQWEQADTLAEWVDLLGVVGVAVGYRLAPEHPHPAPVEDCYAGLEWLARNAAELDVDPTRLLIWGSSAGGGLAAATALLARDRGGPALAHQILQCPMLDDRAQTPSSHELDREGFWDRNSNRTGWTSLLGPAAGGPGVSPYGAPARAEDLRGLPSAFIDVGQVETFRDEALSYAARLSRAGVPVELHMWPGAWHGFAVAAPQAAVSQLAIAARNAYLQRVLC
ncbi:alpha/beta hydrolase [Kitasatospora sp. NBC_01266]|uniref:alpha/beta hydrolase n=1 Tax=Kitasatospora sp. NBC_01266 TaxID=2903572 RepID=UPI002E2EFDA0|nr:alpha/beta hydrolase [Kitasatospora sp. NBC_01266]